MTVGVLAEALVRWQHAAGPFWPYVCAAPFLGTGEGAHLAQAAMARVRLQARAPMRVSSRQRDLAAQLLSSVPLPPLRVGEGGWGGEVSPAGLGGEVFPAAPDGEVSPAGFPVILAELPAEPLLALAPLLAARGWYMVPVVQRWIASPAVLPCRRLMELLLRGAWQIRRPAEPRGAILIADGVRTGPPGYPSLVAGRTFDNRYEYQICRFPSTRFLHAQGVRRVHWITAERPSGGGTSSLDPMTLGLPPVARDLHPYRELLLRAEIDVDVTLWQSA